jgi:SAM-dependent methyltransferase
VTAPGPMSDIVSSAHLRMAELAIGARIALALRVVAERRIADRLADRPKTAESLADETGLPAQGLRRLLRALTAYGIFQESHDGAFAQTELSACMCEGSSPSVREMILVLNDDAVLKAWQQLPAVLESGAPAFASANGVSFFEHIASDRQRSALMGSFMTAIYGPEGGKIAAHFPFGRFGSLVDIGGGQGHVLVEILQRNPALRGALFELPQTAEIAREFLAAKGFAGCDVIAGDFFKSVPPGFDAYFIKSVLHDWNDEAAARILRSCRDAMPEQGRVLIAEIVVEPGRPVEHPHRLIDLEMMVSFGGKERTAEDFEQLLSGAGLKLERITRIENSFLAVLEASRAK